LFAPNLQLTVAAVDNCGSHWHMVSVNSVVVTDDLIKAMLQRDLVSDIPAHVIADAGADDAIPAVDVLAQLQRLQA
jgi:hypothetical protein